MRQPCYINLEQARQVLSEMGVELNQHQMEAGKKVCTRIFNEPTKINDLYGIGNE
jgi:hypothetical protein